MNSSKKLLSPLLVPTIIAMLLFVGFINGVNANDDEETKHRVVIQVSTDDPRTQKIAMNNAVNLQKHYGIDNIEIEIVAYGPGLGMLTSKNEYATRIRSLITQDITFSACANTMNAVKKRTGELPVLSEGVSKVTAGVARIIELQEDGFSYIRP